MTREQAPLEKQLSRLSHRGRDADRDEILTLFLDYVAELGFELYPAQEEALLELLGWRHVVLSTPTGSGKSLVAQALHFQAMAEERISFYTSPIKALVNEKFFDLCDAFGPENVGLMTGDAAVNRDAPIICCTAEILANLALRDPSFTVDYVVMDEFHFYGDRERGSAWQIPLITLSEPVYLLMSATLGDMSTIASELESFTDRNVVQIMGAERPVPLRFEYRETLTQETIQDLLDHDRAPIYLVNFTQRACAEQAQNLVSIKVCSRDQRTAIGEQLEGVRFETPYGKELQRFLRAGIGVHHAGLLPKYRLLVEKLSQGGLLRIISGTDSLGVGVNIPIRTVLFRQMCKFNGEKTVLLSAREFHQMSGRAGRRGFDEEGFVLGQAPEHIAENKKLEAKRIKNPHLKKKLVNKRPPTRGYVHWDYKTFARLVELPPESLVPHFEITHGMILNVLQSEGDRSAGGYGRLVAVIRRCHLRKAEKRHQLRRAAQLFRALREAGIVERIREDGKTRLRVRTDLQREFSLNQALSLFLVQVIDVLDRDSETYAIDLLTLVEAILENPNAVLYKQIDRIKGELVGKLKAEGVEYEERMAQLELVEYPKPNAEFIYATFNDFAKTRPWVGSENIRPKSIAREMFERCMTFNDYVRELGLARSEGVLLRYLTQVYKTATQNVPETYRNEAFEDVLSYFHTMLKRVDSSLIDDWERMMDGEIVRIRDRYQAPEPEKVAENLTTDFKAFVRRIRNELFMLLKALSDRNYADACELVRPDPSEPWTERRVEQLMALYYADHSAIDTSVRARHTEHTIVEEIGERRYRVVQKILDPEGDNDWYIGGVVDVDTLERESDPLISLQEIAR